MLLPKRLDAIVDTLMWAALVGGLHPLGLIRALRYQLMEIDDDEAAEIWDRMYERASEFPFVICKRNPSKEMCP